MKSTEPINDENGVGHTKQEKLRMLGALISGITHEINTPMHYLENNLTFLKIAFKDLLTLGLKYREVITELKSAGILESAISDELEALEEEIDPAYLRSELAEALEQSLEGVALVSRLVLALKDYSYPPLTDFSLVDINKCVDTVCTITKHEWKRAADLTLNLSAEPLYLLSSRDELHQVLLNLVVNAAHAVLEKIADEQYERGNISISTSLFEDMIKIEVYNDGLLVPDKLKNKIFEPHFTTKPTGKGTGLGLNLVKRIVEQSHEGKISLVSDKEHGTIFTIILPHKSGEPEISENQS